MKSNNCFQIIESLSLIVVVHKKTLTKDGIAFIINNVLHNPYFKSNFSVLIDVRNSEIKMTEEEIEESSNFVYEKLKELGITKFAILAKSLQTNKVVKFVRSYKQSSKYQVFLSTDATLYWLGIPIERKPQIEIKLKYLKEVY